ncbi:MAG TPA: alpha-glucan family phosphorylase [Actinomycetota bacterium]|nr:alpha-glucan family phosphorylase [Actinomycetota bacterium]
MARALRSFTVRADLPPALAGLRDIAMNLRWSWDARSQDLFRWADQAKWEAAGQDPTRLLGMIDQDRLEALARDRSFLTFLQEVHDDLMHHLERPRWFSERPDLALRSVAYFSPEFGIAAALPQYSGGLGVLAGDHVKAAGSLGLPLVGVGLFYRKGYFRQELNVDGWQIERYPTLDPEELGLQIVGRVTVDLGGLAVGARVVKAHVGRVPLYLLDTAIDENDEEARSITDNLYGGGEEHRLQQEILLGIGGVRALQVVGEAPQVFHINEGHAGFLALERLRSLILDEGLAFPEAVEVVRSGAVFTTHTPVPAGIDRFPRYLIERYFSAWAQECGVPFSQVMELGREPGGSDDVFNMAVLSFRLSGYCNGVAKLHGQTSRRMFQHLWPDVSFDEIPIHSITNGIHAPTWVSKEMSTLLDRYVLPEWWDGGPERWARLDDASDEDIWRIREQCRERLVGFVRARLRSARLAQGISPGDLAWCDDVFDPGVLTIGFSRRFAGYKRPTLLLSQPERLKALLNHPDRPVQILFAGKAHPADEPGKQMIRAIFNFAQDPEVRRRIAFLEDYDISMAKVLCQGVDLWLNTPRRPLEASGTSGEKAALNGVLNCSILDGWWDEMYDGTNGWAILSVEGYEDLARRDQVEASNLFDVLERRIVPLFYDRKARSVPRGWVRRIRSSLKALGPKVSASRMVREYVAWAYEPASRRSEALAENGYERGRALAAWKARVLRDWDQIGIEEEVDEEAPGPALGAPVSVRARVHLGSLSPDDVAVQLVHGPLDGTDELQSEIIETMVVTPVLAVVGGGARTDEGTWAYEGSFTCEHPGRYGYALRVIPAHPDLITFAEVGCVSWAGLGRGLRID